MVRPSLLAGGIVAALAVGAWLFSPGISPAQAGPGPGGGHTGTYLIEFKVGSFSLLAVATIHADGTWTMSDQTDFGGIPGFESVSAPWRGFWEFTGRNQTTFRGLALNFGSDGFPTTVNRLTGVVTWTHGFDEGEAVTSQRIYSPGEDPLDPDAGTPAGPPLDALAGTIRKMVE